MQTLLPIWQLHSPILDAFEKGNRLVLVAATGSGKTTQVPQMLLDAGLAGDKQIVVLQPRRVAARSVAARVAWERRVRLGAEVGYQIRFEDVTTLGTRISFVTEGILLRWLQDDRHLSKIAILLFDEFHERNLLSDAALAIIKRLQTTSRPDLKIGVMSATLDAEPVARYLGGAPILVSEGRTYGVEVRYLAAPDSRPISEQAAEAVEEIIRSGEQGDILVFMPGKGEINATLNACRALRTGESLELIPLHGELSSDEQDRAFREAPVRKVVISTNVAETSITIDGVRHVVDGGFARVARFDAERGIGTLAIEEISRASAEQRKGRAGRTAPGTCHRLWTENNHLNRPDKNTPEIQRSDLAEVVLLLHSLGIPKAAEFDWLDKPDRAAVEKAEELLVMLGAISEPGLGQEAAGSLTPIGREMQRLPMHPRYSRMLVEAKRLGCVPTAALCAALVSGRDLLMRVGREEKQIAEARERFESSQESDFHTLMRAYEFARQNGFRVEACRRYGIHAQTAAQVEQTLEQILTLAGARPTRGVDPGGLVGADVRRLPTPNKDGASAQEPVSASQPSAREVSPLSLPKGEGRLPTVALLAEAGSESSVDSTTSPPKREDPLPRCLMAGFIDQLCVRRDQGPLECDLTGGRSGTLMRESVVQNSRFLVAALVKEIPGRHSGPLTLLGLATGVKKEWIAERFPQHLNYRVEHLFDRTHKRVAGIRFQRFRDLVIDQEHLPNPDPAAAGRALAQAARSGWFELPLFNHEIKQFIGRTNLIGHVLPELEFPKLDEAAITECLACAFRGLTLAKEAQAAPLRESFFNYVGKERIAWLEELAPLQITFPSDRKTKLTYAESPVTDKGVLNSPEFQVKINECFHCTDHPRICEGKVPVKLWLCGPDGKRLEPTTDWPAFRVKIYPKHRPILSKKFPSINWP